MGFRSAPKAVVRRRPSRGRKSTLSGHSPYSITSSARARSDCGTVRPSAKSSHCRLQHSDLQSLCPGCLLCRTDHVLCQLTPAAGAKVRSVPGSATVPERALRQAGPMPDRPSPEGSLAASPGLTGNSALQRWRRGAGAPVRRARGQVSPSRAFEQARRAPSHR